MSPRIVLIIPAVDEEESIGLVLAEVPRIVSKVIVVDNGSSDRTAERARASGASVVREPRRGYGWACLAGIEAAQDAEILAFLDGDHSDYPEQLTQILDPILMGEADLVIGSRSLGQSAPGAHPWHAIAGTRLCVGLMNLLVGTRATDLGPFRAIRAEALKHLGMTDKTFGWTVEMQLKAHRDALRVKEVPVDYRGRIGKSKVSGTLSGSVRAGARILGLILRQGLNPLIVPGILVSLCVLAWGRGGDETGRVATHLGIFGVAFAAYLLALQVSKDGLTPRALKGAMLIALVWRFFLVPAAPLLSDDVYRYVWEGRIQNHGGNPYRDPPDSPQFTSLRDAVYARVNHKSFSAIYPPLFELAVRGVVTLSDSVIAMKIFFVGCEGLVLVALSLLLRAVGLPQSRILVYAWSPLSLTEVAGSGHNEPFAILFLVLALLFLVRGRPLLSAVFGGLALQAKLLPGGILLSWSRRYRLALLAAVVVSAVLVLPYASAGAALLRTAFAYARLWRFNETLFAPLELLFGMRAPLVAGGLFVSLTLWASRFSPSRAGLVVVGGWLLLAPSVLPWYGLWLLPFLVLEENLGALLFTGSVTLAYLVYPEWQSTGHFQVSWGIRTLEYLPPFLLGLVPSERRLA